MNKLISQGAEAKIYLDTNSDAEQVITKDRISKSYRHPQLDKQIITRRTKSETKILTKALEAGVNVPKVLNNLKNGKFKDLSTSQRLHHKSKIKLEFIEGDRLSETLNSYPEKKQFSTMQKIGEQVAKLHKNNIIHGDLTTSNTILSARKQTKSDRAELISSKCSKGDQVFIIDFGLGFISTKIEDKAVDLHLIKQALEAKHFQNHQALFQQFLKTYKDQEVIKRLEVVEKRGRYKH